MKNIIGDEHHEPMKDTVTSRSTFNPLIVRFDRVGSTNTEAARHAARGAAEGLIVLAREQTDGRGRRERSWSSPPDAGLYLSIVLRPRLKLELLQLITLVSAVAVCDALRDECNLVADIKYPNDLLVGGRKICGILAELTNDGTTNAGAESRAVILGVGINIDARAFPAELRDHATAVEAETKHKLDRESFLRLFVTRFGVLYEDLHAEAGAPTIVREWSARSSYADGKRVRVSTETEAFEGTTCGLAPDGALCVKMSDGTKRKVYAGDVIALRTGRGEEWLAKERAQKVL